MKPEATAWGSPVAAAQLVVQDRGMVVHPLAGHRGAMLGVMETLAETSLSLKVLRFVLQKHF